MAPAGVEFLVLLLGWLVNCLRVECGVDHPQEGYHVGITVTEAPDLKEILVDIDDVEMVLPQPDLAQVTQLEAGALDKVARGVEPAGGKVVDGQWCAHARFFTRTAAKCKCNPVKRRRDAASLQAG